MQYANFCEIEPVEVNGEISNIIIIEPLEGVWYGKRDEEGYSYILEDGTMTIPVTDQRFIYETIHNND